MPDELTVIDHHHDADAGVFRLVTGYAVERVVPLTDETGAELRGPDVPLLDENGHQMKSEGHPLMGPGEPMTETVTAYIPFEDFVFADDDPRWHGKSAGAITAEQRKLVREALREREERTPAATEPVPLPGVGEPL